MSTARAPSHEIDIQHQRKSVDATTRLHGLSERPERRRMSRERSAAPGLSPSAVLTCRRGLVAPSRLSAVAGGPRVSCPDRATIAEGYSSRQ